MVDKKHLQGKTVIIKINGLSMDPPFNSATPAHPDCNSIPWWAASAGTHAMPNCWRRCTCRR